MIDSLFDRERRSSASKTSTDLLDANGIAFASRNPHFQSMPNSSFPISGTSPLYPISSPNHSTSPNVQCELSHPHPQSKQLPADNTAAPFGPRSPSARTHIHFHFQFLHTCSSQDKQQTHHRLPADQA